MLLSEVLENWWLGARLNLREISIHKKQMDIEVHILPYFGNYDIKSVDDVLIYNFVIHEKQFGNHITGKGLCINSIIKELQIVGNVMEYAYKKGYIDFNPMTLVKKLKKEPVREFEIYTSDEVEKLINVARPKWLGDMILLVYNTGLRKCECFGLQWADIDFENKSLTVVRSVTAAKSNDRFISEPKTRTSRRKVLLDNATIEMLAKRFKKRTSDIWFFADKNGNLLSPWYNVKYFRHACQKAEIPIRRFYDLRHTHITELIENGIPIPIVQKRVGHSDIKMTMHYVHLEIGAQKSVVDIINKRNMDVKNSL